MEQFDTESNLVSEEEMLLAEEMSAEEAEELARKEEEDRRQTLEDLAYAICGKFRTRASRRSVKEVEWLDSSNMYYGSMATGRAGGFGVASNPYNGNKDNAASNRPTVNIIKTKCDIAISQTVSMQFAGGEKNWDLTPAKDDVDPTSKDKAMAMSKTIESQLEGCFYGREARRAMEDRVILGTGILKGPVNTGKLTTKYVDQGGVWVPVPQVDSRPFVERVNPWFFYPDDTVNEFSMCKDSLEVHPMSGIELRRLMSNPGFNAAEIGEVLKTKPGEYVSESYSLYQNITDTNPYLFKDKYLVIEYHGPITVDQLGKLDVECPAYDPINEEYYGEVWVVDGKVIRIELENIEGAFELPYAVTTWLKDPASVFGFGAPQIMKDSQRVVTATWHMILDNASISSGPQMAIHKGFVSPADGTWDLAPRKAWYLEDPAVPVSQAIQFFYPPSVIPMLMEVMNTARQFSEEESATPLMAGGINGPDTAESATGQLMMRDASTTLLDFASEEYDDNVTEKIIRRFYGWNMQYNDDPSIKGNFSVDVRTSSEYKNKQMHIRDMERLSLEASQNENLGIVVNMDELTRARLSMMNLPSGKIIRTLEEVEAFKQQQAQNKGPSPEQIKFEIERMNAEISAGRLKLDEAKLQFDQTLEQRRAEMEHEQKMAANYARIKEAEAQVITSQNQKDAEMIKLAARQELDMAKVQASLQQATMNNETKVFLKSMEENRKSTEGVLEAGLKQNEQAQTQEELNLKREMGTGI